MVICDFYFIWGQMERLLLNIFIFLLRFYSYIKVFLLSVAISQKLYREVLLILYFTSFQPLYLYCLLHT